MGKAQKKKKAKQQRTDIELRRSAHHVSHDIRMLGRAFDEHRTSPFAYTSWFVHARSVMDFLDDTWKCDDDVIATDYMPLVQWIAIANATTKPEDYRPIRHAVNALASHLSYKRLDYEKGGIKEHEGLPSEEITNYLLGLARLFTNALPSKRQVWFAGAWR